MPYEYKVTFNSTEPMDSDYVIQTLLRSLTLPLLLMRIVQFTGWKPFVKASVGVLHARKWAQKIEEESGIELDPVMDIAAQHRGEYLEWVPDGPEEGGA
jgi:hypothetical protein